jgi:hypothetical protein
MADRDIKNTLKKLLEETEVLRNQARDRGLAFASPSSEQLEKKLRSSSSHSPFIMGMAYTGYGSPTDPFSFGIYVHNPDNFLYYSLFAYFFFGPANMISNISTSLLSVDERLFRMFARFPFIYPGTGGAVNFNYKFPSGTQLGVYMGNAFIFTHEFFDVSTYADRGSIYVTIE